MKLKDYFTKNYECDYGDVFYASGSFGIINDDVVFAKIGDDTYSYTTDEVEVVSTVERRDNGVVIRRDRLKNISDKEIIVNNLSGKIYLEGNDYDVYAQFNSWQNESAGEWQPLKTQIKVASFGIRTCEGATPMMGVYNKQTGKTHVFHLVDNCRWKIEIYKKAMNLKNVVTVLEYGFDDKSLRLKLNPDETVNLPEIIFYECDSKLDFDAYKLHKIINEKFPKKSMPVTYNTWMYNFDNFTVESIFSQIDAAAYYGFEAFIMDAGWFGEKGNWFDCVGDWEETDTAATNGRLLEIADRVRANGMKFGLWFEPERAESKSNAKIKNPNYYFAERFTDFANEDARNYVLDKVSAAIEKYGVEIIKFDFNKALDFDPSQRGFYDYFIGNKIFVKKLRERFPNLYLINCASGGLRMSLSGVEDYDSFWLSDCHSPVKGVEVVKNTLKRLPPNRIDRWAVTLPLNNLPKYGTDDKITLTVSCGNQEWSDLEFVEHNYIFNFLFGGGCGFSCDLTAFSDKFGADVKNFISSYKKSRDFFNTAMASVCCETNEFTVIDYFNEDKSTVYTQVFSQVLYQNELTVYPSVNANFNYDVNGKKVSGADIIKNGVTLSDLKDNDCVLLTIKKIN